MAVGDRIQLTLQTAPVVLKRSGHGPIGGLGATEAALKWRFLEQERTKWCDISMFPRIIFNLQQSSPQRGLSERGTRFQIPFQAAHKWGPLAVDIEAGPLVSTVGRGEWLYGVVAGYGIPKRLTLMGELHGTSRMNWSRQVITANAGLRYEFTDTRILIVSLGHEIYSADEPRALIGYCGLQVVY